MSDITRTAVASAIVLAALAGTPAQADDAADFYKGKTVTVLVGFGAGGGFGLYSRALSEFMGEKIPGNPELQLQFMPGAGGLKAANYYYNVSPKDGSVMAILSQVGPLNQRLHQGRDSNIKHDFAKFQWLGRLVTMEAGYVGRNESGFTSIESLKTKPSVACANGKAHQGYINSKSIADALKLKTKIVIGYPGSKDMMLALERGECNVLALSLSTWETRGKSLITRKVVTPLMVIHTERSKFWPDIPTTVELATNPDDKAVLKFIAGYGGVGRAYSLPPGAPMDRVAAMRKAFVATYEDADFLAAAKKRKMPLNPAPGSVVKQHVMETLNAPEKIVKMTREILGYNES